MKLNTKQIQDEAMAILEAHPRSIRWVQLLRTVEDGAPATPHNTIHGSIHKLLITRTDIITKVARGTYRLAKFVQADKGPAVAEEEDTASYKVESVAPTHEAVTEQDFYASFAAWLVENDDATFAEALGGNGLGSNWGTPDVIGVLKPLAQDIFKFPPQIITAEIKAVSSQPVVAFGQAVAYRLFSHRSYVVIPTTTGTDDMDRLKSLCSIHGVGLVTFVLDKTQPNYDVIVLPTDAVPDVFYVNMMLEKLKANAPSLLNKLF